MDNLQAAVLFFFSVTKKFSINITRIIHFKDTSDHMPSTPEHVQQHTFPSWEQVGGG
jgi:hypothetical protein